MLYPFQMSLRAFFAKQSPAFMEQLVYAETLEPQLVQVFVRAALRLRLRLRRANLRPLRPARMALATPSDDS